MITGEKEGRKGNPIKWLKSNWLNVLLLMLLSILGSAIGLTMADYLSIKYGW